MKYNIYKRNRFNSLDKKIIFWKQNDVKLSIICIGIIIIIIIYYHFYSNDHYTSCSYFNIVYRHYLRRLNFLLRRKGESESKQERNELRIHCTSSRSRPIVDLSDFQGSNDTAPLQREKEESIFRG